MRDTKVCPNCKQEKLTSEFFKNKSKSNGLCSWCKVCMVACSKEYYRKNGEKYRAQKKEYYENNREKIGTRIKEYRKNNGEKVSTWQKLRNRKIKKIVMEHYGGKCECCGETRIEFLTIDHVNGDGAKHRRKLGKIGGNFYRYLKKNNYPTDPPLQVLCFNCNCTRGFSGYCPHELEEYQKKYREQIT